LKRSKVLLGAAALGCVAANCSSSDEIAATTTAASSLATTDSMGQQARTTTTTALVPARVRCNVDGLATATEPVEITVWLTASGKPGEIARAQIEAFDAERSDITVTLETRPYSAAALDELAAMDDVDRPDLVLLYEFHTRLLADSGSMVPYQECIDAGAPPLDLLPAIEASFEVGDVGWAVPYNVNTPVLFYDANDFRSAGLDPLEPPSTPEELRSAAEALVSTGAAPGGMAIDTGASNGGSWFVEQWTARTGAIQYDAGDGRTGSATTATWSDPAVDALTWLRDMVDDGLATNVGDNNDASDDLVQFLSLDRSVGMTIHSSSTIGDVIDILATGVEPTIDFAVAPFPGPGPLTGAFLGGGAWWMPDTGDAVTAAAAGQLAAALASPAAQAELAAATGLVPVTASAVDEGALAEAWARHPQLRAGYDQVIAMDPTGRMIGPSVGPREDLRAELQALTSAVLAGAEPRPAVAQAVTASAAILAAYNATG
jgi:sn-glycerol 3-phosphate transport system substrate-binding protein